MAKTVKVASLFDGIGGTLLSSVMCGAEPVWASEIEPVPISITKRHFPQVKHYGDITKINGAEVEPVDIIVGGSPCQDLSVAGKREGLDGERSGLFMDQIRIVKEMRDATGKRTGDGPIKLPRPRYMVWENVPGAFSSNKGEDFRAVLEETAKIADEAAVIPRPDKGKWANAGAIMGDGWSIAWRVFDAQFWGVPQRRRRIYLVADFGGQSAPEVLFERESVSGDIAESGTEGQRVARDVANCFRETGIGYWGEGVGALRAQPDGSTGGNVVVTGDVAGGVGTPIWDIGDRRKVADESVGVSPTLLSKMGTGGNNVPIVPTLMAGSDRHMAVTYSLQGNMIGRAEHNGPQGGGVNEDVSFTLNTTDRHAVCYPINTQVITRHNALGRGTGFGLGEDGSPAYTLQAGHEHGVAVIPINDKATRYKGGGATRNKDGSGNGLGIGKDGDPAPTLTSGDKHAVFDARGNGDGSIAPTMTGDHKNRVTDYTPFCVGNGQLAQLRLSEKVGTLNCMHDQQAVIAAQSVRRLTPLECERLQGYPDGWTNISPQSEVTVDDLSFWREVWDEWQTMQGKKLKSDKQIIKWLQSEPADTARYKGLGNSFAIPNAFFVISRCVEQLRKAVGF